MANNSKNIIVGAGVLYIGANSTEKTITDIPNISGGNSSKTFVANSQGTYQNPDNVSSAFTHVGFTSEGVDFSFEPDYGEVQVDQLLDVAKIYKQGQKVMVKTTLTEATLENFLVVLGGKTGTSGDLNATSSAASSKGTTRALDLNGGALGYSPLERSILIVGPGPDSLLTAGANGGTVVERIYLGCRALSMETVSIGIKRNEATVFPVTFRLLPSDTAKAADGNAIYGKVIDRVYA